MSLIKVQRFIFLITLFFVVVTSSAQNVPWGYNYQTTVRDGAGLIIPNQKVQIRFSFYSGSPSGTLQWQETSFAFTDIFGHLNLIIGTGTNTGAGLMPSFDKINWSLNAYYLKISIDVNGGNSFIDMGLTQLFSVPYAFYTLKSNTSKNSRLSNFSDVNLAGIAAGKLLKWNGAIWAPAVDNSNDTVLYAYTVHSTKKSDTSNYTYNIPKIHSVHFAYFTDTSQYAFNSSTTTISNSSVHSDTAIYAFTSGPSAWQRTGNITGTGSKYIGTNTNTDLIFKTNGVEKIRLKSDGNLLLGTPVDTACVSQKGNDGLLHTGVLGSGNLSSTGAGTRLLWYPAKASFRAGGVTSNQWDNVNIGNYSFAIGYNTIAGNYGFASGNSCIASGDYAVAMGRKCQATAVGVYPNGTSVALGDSCSAIGARCLAIGRGCQSSVPSASISIGTFNTAAASISLALGYHTNASGSYSAALGYFSSNNAKSGSFVYADASSSLVTKSTANNQFLVRASGGVIFYTDSLMTMGSTIAPGSGSWSSVSDVNKKENFQKIDPEDILKGISQLKISSWNYKTQSKKIHHIGPMALDFYQMFHVGENNISISCIDMDGIILTGIQALNLRLNNLALNSVDELKYRIEKLDNTELSRRLDMIEAELNRK